ncbi:MAG: FtsX-like permease family protein [Acidobacteriota bacterium]
MIRHVVKLMWNRKRQNALMLLEILGSFLVLFALAAVALSIRDSARRPLGFLVEDLWIVTIETQDPAQAQVEGLAQRMLDAVSSHDAVEAAGAMPFPLYDTSGLTSSWSLEDREPIFVEAISVSLGIERALALDVEGRFFSEADLQDALLPIVINRSLALRAFGADFVPEGQILAVSEFTTVRVVGLVESFLKGGDLEAERPTYFSPMDPADPLRFGRVSLALRMRAGSSAELEEGLIERLRQVAPAWSFDLNRASDLREAHLQSGLAPLALGGLVALFLLAMVALGLTGVLWQNVSRRTREVGLRRAQGATAADIRRQIVLELMTLTAVGIVLGGAIAAQLPILGLVGSDTSSLLLLQAFVLAALALTGLTLICGLYPSQLATRVQPAQALQHS